MCNFTPKGEVAHKIDTSFSVNLHVFYSVRRTFTRIRRMGPFFASVAAWSFGQTTREIRENEFSFVIGNVI